MTMNMYEIGNYAIRNYILETEIGWLAIDTGYANGYKRFLSRFKSIAPISDLRWIFLTHAHDDHAGFLAEVKKYSNAKVIAHFNAVETLAKGENQVIEGAGYTSFSGHLFGTLKKDFKFPPVRLDSNDILLESEAKQQVFLERGLPLRIVFLPGHTSDSMGLFNEESKKMFVGDAAMNAVISKKKHTIWVDDLLQYQISWDKIIALNPSKIYPSHGKPFDVKDLIKHRHFMDKRKLIK